MFDPENKVQDSYDVYAAQASRPSRTSAPSTESLSDMATSLMCKHYTKQGSYLRREDAYAIVAAGARSPEEFNPKATTRLARTFFARDGKIHVKFSRTDARASRVSFGEGNFKKKRYVTTMDMVEGTARRHVLLTANDRTATDGGPLLIASAGNVSDILAEEKKARKVQLRTRSPYVVGPAKEVIVYSKKEKKTGKVRKRISLIVKESSSDARDIIPASGVVSPWTSVVDQLIVLRDAALGLQAMHDAGYVHRDVTKANILVDRDASGRVKSAKIADLGFAIRPSKITISIVTNGDYPPEVVSRDPKERKRHFECSDDVYAFASIMIGLRLPAGRNTNAVADTILEERDQIVRECRQRDPKRRPTGREVARRLTALIRMAKEDEQHVKALKRNQERTYEPGIAARSVDETIFTVERNKYAKIITPFSLQGLRGQPIATIGVTSSSEESSGSDASGDESSGISHNSAFMSELEEQEEADLFPLHNDNDSD